MIPLLYACNETVTSSKTEDLPVASFNITGDNFTADTLNFENNSTNATSFSWSFGDGTQSDSSDTIHIYSDFDVFDVTLTAKNNAGEDKLTKKLVVYPSEMTITSITVNEMPFFKSDGSTWDYNSGPDIKMVWADSTTLKMYEISAIKNDLIRTELPYTFEFSKPVIIHQSAFTHLSAFILIDDDNTSSEMIGTSSSRYQRLMDHWVKSHSSQIITQVDQTRLTFNLLWN